jgi:DNA-binding GntR family transcriptional regulator
LPNEDALGKEFYVSRVTVNRALRDLRDEGTIHVRRGIGVFVNPPAETIELQDVPQYVKARLNAGDKLLFRRPDGTIDPIIITKTK